MKKINLKGVTVQTWARTIVLLLALVSQLCVILGKRTEAIDVDRSMAGVCYIRSDGYRLNLGVVEEQQLHQKGSGSR